MKVFWMLAFGLTVLTLNAWQSTITTPPLPGDSLSHQIASLGRQCVSSQFDAAIAVYDGILEGIATLDDSDTLTVGTFRQILKGSKIALAKARDKKLRELPK